MAKSACRFWLPLMIWAPTLLLLGALVGFPVAMAQGASDAGAGSSRTEPGPGSASTPTRSVDPFERFNRAVFTFNGVLDHFLIKPVAQAYEAVVPRPIRTGVSNVFGNVGDVWSAANLALQGKGTRAVEMTLRVAVNTVLGLGGVLDVATEAGLERQSEDFGQTLATWGVGSGPYLVLPIFGPSTVRDASAFIVDRSYSAWAAPNPEHTRIGWLGLQITDARTDALPFTRMLDTVALDKYLFVRDAFLTRRRSLIHDGNPPPLDDEEQAAAPLIDTTRVSQVPAPTPHPETP